MTFAMMTTNHNSEIAGQTTPRITGLGKSVIGTCGQSNDVYHTGCIVCRKTYPAIKEEITLGYLGTWVLFPGETYDTHSKQQ